uniref:MIF4G domain-containing protein n=1 Tax=Gongylonema pulchrum TaxID=637853 RepID=A0A183DBK3_9BILA
LRDRLPGTKEMCLEIMPAILSYKDTELHCVVVEICRKLLARGRNPELRDLLEIFLQGKKKDSYKELRNILHGKNDLSEAANVEKKPETDLEKQDDEIGRE